MSRRIMKLIVDEMPKEPKECIFSEHYSTGYVCGLHQGRGCEPIKCNKLLPVSKLQAREFENLGGGYGKIHFSDIFVRRTND